MALRDVFADGDLRGQGLAVDRQGTCFGKGEGGSGTSETDGGGGSGEVDAFALPGEGGRREEDVISAGIGLDFDGIAARERGKDRGFFGFEAGVEDVGEGAIFGGDRFEGDLSGHDFAGS